MQSLPTLIVYAGYRNRQFTQCPSNNHVTDDVTYMTELKVNATA